MSTAETRTPAGPLVSLDPLTGEVVGTHPVHGAAEVAAVVARARMAAAWWGGLSYDERRRRLRAWKAVLARRARQLADLVSRETGKPSSDALLEIVFTLEHLEWAACHAGRVLGPRRVHSPPIAVNHVATVAYEPLGVVGVIGPWNYPVLTTMGSISSALSAGNAVVLKPSELTPGVGEWLARTSQEAIAGPPVLQVVTGYGDTGAALCRAGVDKVSFTGSTATAKRVMATCAETLTPVTIECGGKDALLVDADADLDAAAEAAVWGGMSNGGQTCVGVERVYVHERVYEGFLRRVEVLARELRPEQDTSYGPATLPGQLDVVRAHIDDALARGGRALVGGRVTGRYVEPTVLVDVPEDALAVTEETFGPTLTVTRVADMDEAVRRTNASRYGLGNAVFSRARGPELARRLRSGVVSVDAVLNSFGVPALPFGGVGDSGFGRVGGADGLREFSRVKAIARQRFRLPVAVTSFRRTRLTDSLLVAWARLRHGRPTMR